MRTPDEIDKTEHTAAFLRGMAMTIPNLDAADVLKDAAKRLENMARHMCAHGFVGCRGGHECTSDHK